MRDNAKDAYRLERNALLESLAPLTGGSFSEVYDLAKSHPSHAATKKYCYKAPNPAAFKALENSFVELLKNSIDVVLQAHVNCPVIPPVLNATMCVYVDESDPKNVSVRCVDNGPGFPQDFLNKMSTTDARKAHNHVVSSNKATEAGARVDIPLYFGGRGKGLSMLIGKIDVGDQTMVKAAFADIKLTNQINDSSGKIEGAVITIVTSKEPVINDKIKSAIQGLRTTSPSSVIDVTLDSGPPKLSMDDDEQGSASPFSSPS